METLGVAPTLLSRCFSRAHDTDPLPTSNMMKLYLLVCVLTCVCVCECALECTAYCALWPCKGPVSPAECRAPQQYVPRYGGRCGCCPACVTPLADGAVCRPYSRQTGGTPSALCSGGLSCVRGRCQRVVRKPHALAYYLSRF